jgi:DNA-binding CsgD family transcriptional regulator
MSPRSYGLVERDAEIATIHSVLERASVTGERLVMSGRPGMGRSALLLVARDYAVANGWNVLTATSTESSSHIPYSLLTELLSPLLAGIVSPESVLAGPSTMLRQLATAVPDGDELSPASVAYAVREALLGLADTTPTAIIMDDHHWADSESLEVLGMLLNPLADRHIAVVLTVREPWHLHSILDEFLASPLTLTLRPAPLSLEGIGMMSPGVDAEGVLARTGGVPLYVVAAIDGSSVSGTRLAAAIRQRLLARGPWAMRVAVAAALCEAPVSRHLLRDATGATRDELDVALRELADDDILTVSADVIAPRYPMVGEMLPRLLSPDELVALSASVREAERRAALRETNPLVGAPLTVAELRVSELAADGRSNTEIAELLFVTRKTVEFHLRRSFRKLDISSRAMLAAALETQAP